jgi:tetratricopeptide (TPR) repeat protein
LDEEIQKRVKNTLGGSRKLYEAHKFKEAATALDEAMKLQAFQPVLAYDLALCYHQSGERDKALEYLRKAKAGTADPKQKQKLLQLLTFFTTGESVLSLNDSDRDRVARVNRLTDSIGLEASLEDEGGEETSFSETDTLSSQPPSQAPLRASPAGSTHSDMNAGHRASLCNALAELKGTLATSPSTTFDLANCAESNGRPAEAVRLLEKYLEMTPNALDASEVRARIDDLKSLLTLPGQSGVDIRRLYASAYGSLAERKYDRALADFNKAGELAPPTGF